MTRQKRCVTDFSASSTDDPSENYYDIHFDAELIEQSIAKQYGILPSRQGELIWSDWCKLVSGLMEDTPLGRVVALRMENDPEVLKNLSASQRRIRSEWKAFCLSKATSDPKHEATIRAEMVQLQAALKAAFYHPDGR